ncbi:MAG: cadherin-like beta sandwich domain-containing protein [Lachnospiraceae bacterium]|nr:cadherin-like beta sandwich domain-containing protein [Lachnospiraceae bacterium]
MSGYFSYLDGNGAAQDSEYFSQSCTVTVTESSGGGSAPERGAGADNNYGYGDGTYINGNATGEGSGNTAVSYIRLLGSDRKEISLNDDGHGIYSATVSNSVEKVTIEAGAEDEKASVSGTGEKSLKVGLNTFDIVVTAENGLQTGYQINITRKEDRIALSDLEAEMKSSKADSITVKLADGDMLDAKLLKAIKAWGKTLYLNRYDEEDHLIYGWTIIGANIEDDMTSFDPLVSFESDIANKIAELSNFATGKIINLAYSGKLPEGTKLTLCNKTEFEENSKLHLYYFDKTKNELTLEEQEITAGKDQVILSLTHASEYFLTRSLIPTQEKEQEEPARSNAGLWLIIGAILIILLAAALTFVIIKNRKRRNDDPHNSGDRSERPELQIADDFEADFEEELPKDGRIATKDIKIDPYYAVTDITPEIGEKVKAAADDLSETQILRFEDMEHQPESETTILRYEDMDHNPETETTILRYEDMNHSAETETTILSFEEIDKRLNDE